MHQPTAAQRFVVSPSGFDNIGAVLNGMGQGFEHESIRWRHLPTWSFAGGNNVLFLNCSLRFSFGYGWKIAPVLRAFVEQGGILYASDWAASAVKAAFPGMLDFDTKGQKGILPCDVVDRGLQEFAGKQVNIMFDVGAWRRLTNVNSAVRVYVEAAAGKGLQQRLPIIIGFNHGRGHVLYTSLLPVSAIGATVIVKMPAHSG